MEELEVVKPGAQIFFTTSLCGKDMVFITDNDSRRSSREEDYLGAGDGLFQESRKMALDIDGFPSVHSPPSIQGRIMRSNVHVK
ncbi:MAG: hypothetical protein WCL50_11910 [Spirochaetota bacterium]